MDWSNESYVRVYTRDTADWQVLSWQARGLWLEMLRKADRAGVIQTSHGTRGLAALIRWPVDVVQQALAELLEDGCVQGTECPSGFVIPNFIEAQEAKKSDKLRQRELRQTRAVTARDSSITKRDADVTKRDETVTTGHAASPAVTDSHDASRDVTLCSALPSGALPSPAGLCVVPPSASDPKPHRKKRISKDWAPNDESRETAKSLGLDVEHEALEFRNYWLGTGKPQADWDAMFQSRLATQSKFYATRRKPAATGASLVDRQLADIARMEREEAEAHDQH